MATNPFVRGFDAFINTFDPELRRRRAILSEQAEQLNPAREALLQMLTGQRAFSGGPASEFAPGTPGLPQQQPPSPFADLLGGAPTQPMREPTQAVATPVEPPQRLSDRNQLPPDLRPPPSIDAHLRRAANKHDVPVNALRALAAQESGFRPEVVGQTPIDLPGQEGDRAMGLFQFTPQEAAKIPGFDPNDPAQAADETARRLRARLEEGKPLDIALMEHFSGPNKELQGPRSQQFRREVTEKFQRLEQAAPSLPEQPRPPRGGLAEGERVGPFGTILGPSATQQSPAAQLLASVAQDPAAFAEMFAREGGVEGLFDMLRGGDGTQQTRVISGDTPQGRAIGLQPGERARVKGQVSPGGQFFPQEVVAKPFTAGEEGGGPLVTLMDMETGEVKTRRRDDPEVDRLVGQNHVVASDGRALESLENMSQGERRELRNAQVGTKTYIASVADGLRMLNENPDINTFVARGASLINDLRQEAKAFAGALGTEFDENIFDLTAHADTFRQLGIERERMQSLITSLAFQRAVAEKGGAGRITNRDIERFIQEIGGRSSDPVALAQVLQDTAQRAARSFRINFETRTGAPFQGDLGLGQLPQFEPRQQFTPAREGAGGPVQISSDAEYDALPSGTEFLAPDGTIRRKP